MDMYATHVKAATSWGKVHEGQISVSTAMGTKMFFSCPGTCLESKHV